MNERQRIYAQEQRCRALYQLSREPGFAHIVEILQETSDAARAPFPNSVDTQIAFTSCAIARGTVEQIFETLNQSVSEGKRLTELEDQGEDHNAEDGPTRRRRC